MIKNIKDKATQDIYDGVASKASRKLPKEVHQRARDLLDSLNSIRSPQDLRLPPGNRLHKLKGDLNDYWSVSINDQWRIIFKFEDGSAVDVEITDYHD